MKLLLIVLAFLLSACSTTHPAITGYRLDTNSSKISIKSNCKAKSLKVSQVFLKSSLMSKQMKYVVGQYEEYAFNDSEWSQNPNKAITQEIVKELDNADMFSSVESYKSFTRADYTLESSVLEFTQHFSSDERTSFVKVDISFSLIDNKTMQVMATKHFIKELKTDAPTAASGVKALNILLAECLREMKLWLAKDCT